MVKSSYRLLTGSEALSRHHPRGQFLACFFRYPRKRRGSIPEDLPRNRRQVDEKEPKVCIGEQERANGLHSFVCCCIKHD